MSLEIYQAIVDTASAVGSLVAVCLAYKAFDVSRNISDHEQDNERTRLTIDALNKLQDEVLSKIYCPELYEIKSDLQEKEYKIMLSKFEFFAVAVKNKVYSEELVIKCASESIFWTFSKLFPFMIGKLRQADDRFSASLWLAERCIQGNAKKQKKIPGNDVQSRIANSFRSILKYSVFGIPFSHKTARQEPTIYSFGVLVLLYKVFLRK